MRRKEEKKGGQKERKEGEGRAEGKKEEEGLCVCPHSHLLSFFGSCLCLFSRTLAGVGGLKLPVTCSHQFWVCSYSFLPFGLFWLDASCLVCPHGCPFRHFPQHLTPTKSLTIPSTTWGIADPSLAARPWTGSLGTLLMCWLGDWTSVTDGSHLRESGTLRL